MRAALACLAFALFVPPLTADVPPVCDLSSSLPPSKNTIAFETALRPFLTARCYETLGGRTIRSSATRDRTSTATTTEPIPPSASGTRRRRQLDDAPPDKRATTPILDNAIIVKEMFPPPATDLQRPAEERSTPTAGRSWCAIERLPRRLVLERLLPRRQPAGHEMGNIKYRARASATTASTATPRPRRSEPTPRCATSTAPTS